MAACSTLSGPLGHFGNTLPFRWQRITGHDEVMRQKNRRPRERGRRAGAAHPDRVCKNCTFEGRSQEKKRSCGSCGARWIGYEEKETDVNISTALIEDAVLDFYDTALLISGDTDLRPAVASVKRLRPRKLVFVGFPPRRYSARLAQAVDAYIRIGHDKVRNAQLPPKIVTKGGITLQRPEHWI
jgi:uncharacterized LabA/DUF88 family protein